MLIAILIIQCFMLLFVMASYGVLQNIAKNTDPFRSLDRK